MLNLKSAKCKCKYEVKKRYVGFLAIFYCIHKDFENYNHSLNWINILLTTINFCCWFFRCSVCDCDPTGSLNGGICDSYTDPNVGMIAGQCRCKLNVRGQRCDYCNEGHFGISQDDPLGCQRKFPWLISGFQLMSGDYF